ncbi:NADPH:quinone reductase [Tsukamurella pulmonis]|uniref:NADPH:quinone reductase n=4 Tax=Tsukamurella pulmonis TaxID=47312 RepID=A0A1H1BNW3_9ACTN|nr:NAD(P)-dependent alcohol dehydrogenase [Tsukamurella pulmonis]SDQ53627.1 NADPH:quinone reductase [Tsukamurella pulmonis]SUP24846.1 Zinc-type alcohol dehydrogenase-like protein SA1988 [Tsukamurella pulmonis]
MRAALFDRYGPPDVLYAGTVPLPAIGPDDVLVRVRAVSVNGGELLLRSGAVPRWLLRGPFPRRTGLDFVGDVAAIGVRASGYAVGDRVWGLLSEKPDATGQALRSLAEYVAVRPAQIAAAPASLTPIEAATLPVGGLTALLALRREAGLRSGESVLVRGAAGGVGSAAVQVARALGAGPVTGLAAAGAADFVTGLGADRVVDYRRAEHADLGRFDVVIDTVGTDLRAFRRLLTSTGRMVTVRFDTENPVRSLATIATSVVHGSRRIRFFRGGPDSALLAEVARMAEAGALRPVLDETYRLADVAGAHRRLEAGGVRGKVVVDVDRD